MSGEPHTHATDPGIRATVITVSDRSAAGEREDLAGPTAVARLREAGYLADDATIAPDGSASVAAAIRDALASGARLVVTTGGTGIAPRDETPEGTRKVIDREVPGIGEELRRIGSVAAPGGVLSRGIAGVAGDALVVNLPGSPKAVAEGTPVILRVAAHALAQLAGSDHG